MALEAKITDIYNRLTQPDQKMQQFWDEMDKVKDNFKNFAVKIQKETNSRYQKMEEDAEKHEAATQQNEYQLDKLKQEFNLQRKNFEELKFKVDETHKCKHNEIDERLRAIEKYRVQAINHFE